MPGALVDTEDAEVSDTLTGFGSSWASIQDVSYNVCEKKHRSHRLPDIPALPRSGEEVLRVTCP